ncbi:MAG: transposase [Armatimonadetes bacterium]|nr:transposase [Armatimonadota bacterium]
MLHPTRQNGYIESFFGKLRDELPPFEVFHRGDGLQAALTEFQDHNNNDRPHQALGGLTPVAYNSKGEIYRGLVS